MFSSFLFWSRSLYPWFSVLGNPQRICSIFSLFTQQRLPRWTEMVASIFLHFPLPSPSSQFFPFSYFGCVSFFTFFFLGEPLGKPYLEKQPIFLFPRLFSALSFEFRPNHIIGVWPELLLSSSPHFLQSRPLLQGCARRVPFFQVAGWVLVQAGLIPSIVRPSPFCPLCTTNPPLPSISKTFDGSLPPPLVTGFHGAGFQYIRWSTFVR